MLSDAFLSRLDTLMLAMKGRASGGAGGARRSRQTGSSAEFSDYREYIPGDDIRRIDWNAMARFDKIFLKLFMEEQESAVTVLLDGSGSMAEKWTAARRAAEAVGYLALTGGDRLRGIFLQGGDPASSAGAGPRLSPLLSGRQAFARLTQFLDTCVPAGAGSLTQRVLQIEGLRKGLCFLITDGYEEDGIGTALDNLRYRGQECALIQPLSPFELSPALDGAVKLTDAETGAAVNLLADREALESYQRALEAFLRDIRETCFRRETPYALLDAGKNFEETFIPLLSESGMI
jgi:uncharacterized protein (DUF58 family)